MKRATLLCSLVLSAGYISIFQPLVPPRHFAAQAAESSAPSTSESICNDLEGLVRQYYPKAKITRKGDDLHFEYKTKLQATRSSNRPVPIPTDGGILGELALKKGTYEGADKDRLPSEVPDGFHTTLTMAPYSQTSDRHLFARLVFPSDVPFQFKEQFKEIIKSFNAGEAIPKANDSVSRNTAAAIAPTPASPEPKP